MIFVEFRNEKTGKKFTGMLGLEDTLRDVKETKKWLAEAENVDVTRIIAKFVNVEKGGK